MQPFNPAPMLAALKPIFEEGPTSLALSMQDLLLLASNSCEPQFALSYTEYLGFLDAFSREEPSYPNGEAIAQIHRYIRTAIINHRRNLMAEIMASDTLLRKPCWLMNLSDKEAKILKQDVAALRKHRLQTRPKDSPTTETTKPKAKLAEVETPSEANPTTTITEAAIAVKAPEPIAPETSPETVTTTKTDTPIIAELKPESPAKTTTYDLTTPLKHKWKGKFRPDWPWQIKGVREVKISVADLRALETEIAAEKAAGMRHGYESFNYKPLGELYQEGTLVFRNNYSRLPTYTYTSS